MDDNSDPRLRYLADEDDPYFARLRNGEPIGDVLSDAIKALQREAQANGLTDEILNEEIAAWYAELKV